MVSIKDFIVHGTALTCHELLESEKARNRGQNIGIDQVDEDNWTALHHTCHLGHFALTQLLIDYGASLDRRTNQGESPLLLAVKAGHRTIFELLLSVHKARIADINRSGQNSLHIAINNNDYDMLLVISRCCGSIPDRVINQRDYADKFPLYLACINSRLDIITLLLNHDANACLHVRYKTLLRIACHAQQSKIVAVLLQHGAFTTDLTIMPYQFSRKQMPYDLGCRAVFEEHGICTYTPFVLDDYFGLHDSPHFLGGTINTQFALNTPFDHKTLIARKDYLNLENSPRRDRVNVLNMDIFRCMLEYGVDVDSAHVIRHLTLIIAATCDEEILSVFLLRQPDSIVGALLAQAFMDDLSLRSANNEKTQLFLLQQAQPSAQYQLDAAYIEPETGLTLLCVACIQQATTPVFEALLQLAPVISSLHHRSLDNNTAILHLAKNANFLFFRKNDTFAVVKLLINAGVNIHDEDENDCSAFELLLAKGKKFRHEQEMNELRMLQDFRDNQRRQAASTATTAAEAVNHA